jgi:hypothetical protein
VDKLARDWWETLEAIYSGREIYELVDGGRFKQEVVIDGNDVMTVHANAETGDGYCWITRGELIAAHLEATRALMAKAATRAVGRTETTWQVDIARELLPDEAESDLQD